MTNIIGHYVLNSLLNNSQDAHTELFSFTQITTSRSVKKFQGTLQICNQLLITKIFIHFR